MRVFWQFWRPQLPLLGLYFGLALIITFPTILAPHTQFLGGDTGDTYEMARHIWWFKTALQTGQSPFWQSNLGYPDGFSGVSLQADILQFFPMWLFAFVMPLALAFNLTIWLTMALNGWALAFLLRDLLRHELALDPAAAAWGARLAGVIFMAAPTFQGHLFEGHAGLMVQWGAPLYVWAMFRLVRAPRWEWRWALWGILFFQVTPSGHMLQVIYMLLPLTGLFLLARLYQRDWAGAGRIVAMSGISGGLLLVFLIPLIQETLAQTAYTDTGGYVRYSADVLGIVAPSFLHPVFGALLPYTRQVLGINLGEGSMYLGIVAATLATVGALRLRAARWWLLLAVISWVLALGPLLKILDTPVTLRIGEYETYITLPLALVQNLPGFNLARTPGRFNFTLVLALAALAGYGAAWLHQRYRPTSSTLYARQVVVGIGLIAFILFEYQSFWPMPTRTATIPAAVYALRDDPSARAVFDVPYGHLLAAKDALFLQTAHAKPLIAGHVTRQTPVNPAKLSIMEQTLDPILLKSRGADVVILHKQRAAAINQLDRLQTVLSARFPPPFYEDAALALYRTPDATGETRFAAYVPPVTQITQPYAAYFYAPAAGWIELNAQLQADDRTALIYLDDRLIHRERIEGLHSLNLPLPVSREGFYTVRVELEPACPGLYNPVLACRGLTVAALTLRPIADGIAYDLIAYERGIELAGSSLDQTPTTLAVRLWWRFSAPLAATDVRFVHLLDAAGRNVAQSDVALGALPATSEWAETVMLDLRALPPGVYSVHTGWYDFATLRRYGVLTPDISGGQDAAPEIGRITIR